MNEPDGFRTMVVVRDRIRYPGRAATAWRRFDDGWYIPLYAAVWLIRDCKLLWSFCDFVLVKQNSCLSQRKYFQFCFYWFIFTKYTYIFIGNVLLLPCLHSLTVFLFYDYHLRSFWNCKLDKNEIYCLANFNEVLLHDSVYSLCMILC